MEAHRRLSIGTTLALLAVAVVLAVFVRRSELAPSAAAELRQGTAYLDALSAPGGGGAFHPDSATAVASGYLERGRLGLGSPFRLVDLALVDPRLGDLRRTVAWALLAQASRGDGYQVDPLALQGSAGPDGAAQRELIRHTVDDASRPAVGAVAVRLGYELAALEGTVSRGVRDAAVDAAVLEQDRLTAMRDVHRVFSTASHDGDDVLATVSRLRAARALDVEAPSMDAVPPSAGTEVVNGAAQVLASLRGMSTPANDSLRRLRPLLPGDEAVRLARLGAALPPNSAIGVAMRMLPSVVGSDATDPVAPVVASSPNEETFVAALALTRGDLSRAEASRVGRLALRAAVHLRALGQEQPWFPGMPAPRSGEVMADLGLESVRFDASIPQSWRGYYLRMLQTSVGDLRTVLPGVSLRGLSVSFTRGELPDSALAMHDPRTRTLHLSVALSAGTLAHELAHDLDWQTGRRLFPQAGGYGTDHAVRDATGPLARSLRGIAAARIAQPPVPLSSRPAEQFARDVDWLVASGLAAAGKTDGYLTAAQDPFMTGYASAAASDFTVDGASNVVEAVEEMTAFDAGARDAVLESAASPAASLLLATQRAAGLSVRPRRAEPANALWRDADRRPFLLQVPLPACDTRQAGDPQARITALALQARARGLVRSWAARIAPDESRAWAKGALGEAPWSTDAARQMVDRVRNRLASGEAPAFGAIAGPVAAEGLAACTTR